VYHNLEARQIKTQPEALKQLRYTPSAIPSCSSQVTPKIHPKWKSPKLYPNPPENATQNAHLFVTTHRDVFSAHDVISLGPPEQRPRLHVSCGGERNDHLPRTPFEGTDVRYIDVLFQWKVERPWNRQTQQCWLLWWNSRVSCTF